VELCGADEIGVYIRDYISEVQSRQEKRSFRSKVKAPQERGH
jgi:hypothetical protein